MDIAFVSNVIYPFVKGGSEKRIYEIGRRLATEGHDVTVYGRHFWNGPSTMNYEGMTLQATAPRAELHRGDRRSITEAITFSLQLLPSLLTHIDDRGHELIVVSVFPYFPVLATKLATLGRDIPLLTTWHEVWLAYWKEYLGVLAPFGKVVERVTASTHQFPIAVSQVTADRLATIGPKRERIRVIPNGINTAQICNAPLPSEPDGGHDVLFAGRLVEHKNVDYLLTAFNRVADQYDASLGIVGDGPEAESLKQQTSGMDAEDRIDFLGFLDSYEEVLGHMRAADVFVSPSTREGFGITFVEAMAANCTVLAARHPHSAAKEVIGDAGYLVEPNPDSVADVLSKALAGERPPTDPQKRAARYDWSNVAGQAERTYRRALTGNWS